MNGILACVVGMVLVLPGGAQTAKQEHAPAGRSMNSGFSGDFLERAEQHCLAEIELGELAEKKAFSVEVASFARTAVANYTKIQTDLQGVAHALDLQLPSQLSLQDANLKDEIQREKPRKFENDYLDAMVRSSEEQAGAFEDEARTGRVTQVKALAAKDAPLVQSVADLATKTNDMLQAYEMTPRPQYR